MIITHTLFIYLFIYLLVWGAYYVTFDYAWAQTTTTTRIVPRTLVCAVATAA